ncbi:hypothetical protein QZM05_22575 [Burkholderia multivorans]|nr:hypothetical protein [Burkholderia multivorans]
MSGFNTILDRVLSGLPDNYYLAGHKRDGAFEKDILQRYEGKTDIDPLAVESEVTSNWKVTQQTHGDLINIACAYAIAAKRVSSGRDYDKAWEYLCQAQYWYGVSSATVVLPDAIERSHKAKSSANAAKGNANRYGPLRELARELAAAGNYPSKRNAAMSIKDQVVAASQKTGVNLSEMQAETTIIGWLKGMVFIRKDPPSAS